MLRLPKIERKYVIKNSEDDLAYDVYERVEGKQDKRVFYGFLKEDYTISLVKHWLMTYYVGKLKIKRNQIIVECWGDKNE